MTLAQAVDELCAVFASEREAIAQLDHVRLGELAERKLALAGEVARLFDRSREARVLIGRVRVEASANAMLARTASDAIRALLGYDAGGYDRNARHTSTRTGRYVAAI